MWADGWAVGPAVWHRHATARSSVIAHAPYEARTAIGIASFAVKSGACVHISGSARFLGLWQTHPLGVTLTRVHPPAITESRVSLQSGCGNMGETIITTVHEHVYPVCSSNQYGTLSRECQL